LETLVALERSNALRSARRLEVLTIAWVGAEAALGLFSAWRAHSVSLAAFGFDSLVELASASAVLWRLNEQRDLAQSARAEQRSLRFAAICLLLLAAYVTAEAVREWVAGGSASVSMLGIVVTASAVVLMPALAHAKQSVGMRLNSGALVADSRQALFCALQAAIVLLGLLVSRWLHVKHADSVAALLLVPLIVREGVRALRGESCGCSSSQCGIEKGSSGPG
jgi:divalent metal cation (Fe/Co/Zn/Cd) transporter